MNSGFNAELSNSYPWIQVGIETTTLINPFLPLSPFHSYLFLLLWLLLSPVSLYHRVGLTPCRSYHRALVKYCNLTKLLVLFLKHLGSIKNIHFGEIFSILCIFFWKNAFSTFNEKVAAVHFCIEYYSTIYDFTWQISQIHQASEK